MNAFLPASVADFFSNQKPMSRYEQRPTPSQPTNSTRKFAPRTRTSMNAAKRFKYEKYRAYSASRSSCMYAIEYTWISDPMPVTTRIITAASGSRYSVNGALKSPDVIQSKIGCEIARPSGGWAASLATAATETPNDA